MQQHQNSTKKLTAAQARTIPIIAKAKTVNAGIEECAAKKITSERVIWGWWSEKSGSYRAAVESAREQALGDVAQVCRDLCMAEAAGLTAEAIAIAYGKKATQTQLAAIQYVLDKAGVESIGKSQRKNLFALIAVRIQEGKPSEAMEVSVVESTSQ